MRTRIADCYRHRLLIIVALVALFVVYRHTAPPGLTWQHGGVDGGELALASARLGVAHPPGYPLFTALGGLFIRLLLSFTPIVRLQIMSHLLACVTVLAVGYAGWLIASRWQLPRPALTGWLAAAGLGLNRLFWSQAIIVEVYMLLLMLFAIQLVISFRLHIPSAGWRLALLCGVVQGMAISHHLSALLWLPGFLLWWPWRRWPLISFGILLGLWPVLLLVLFAGHDPAANWGGVNLSLRHFLNHLTGAQYSVYLTPLSSETVLRRSGDWLAHIVTGFTIVAALAVPMSVCILAARLKRLIASTVLWWLPLIVFTTAYNAQNTADVYAAPLLVVLALWIALGLVQIIDRLHFDRMWSQPLVLALYAAVLFMNGHAAVDLSHDRQPETFLRETLSTIPPDSVVLTNSDEETFSLWYYHYVEGISPDWVIVDRRLWPHDWYRANLRHIDSTLPLDVEQLDLWLRDPRLVERPLASTTFMLPAGGRSVTGAGLWYISPPIRAQPSQN